MSSWVASRPEKWLLMKIFCYRNPFLSVPNNCSCCIRNATDVQSMSGVSRNIRDPRLEIQSGGNHKKTIIHSLFSHKLQKRFFSLYIPKFQIKQKKNKWNIKCILVFSLFPTRGWYPGMFCMLRSCLNTGKLTACSVKPRGEREACHTSSSYNTAQCGAHHTTLPLGSSLHVVIVISKF